MSLEEAAEVGGFAITTARRWWHRDHAVRREFERLKAALAAVNQSLVEALTDPRSTPWVRAEARSQLLRLMQLTPETSEARDRRCEDRRRDRELQGKSGRQERRQGDARERLWPPSGGVPAFTVVDQSDEGPSGAA